VYFAVFSLPLIHPGIPVAYDRAGLILWFCVAPLEALIAFLPGSLCAFSFGAGAAQGRGGSWIGARLRVILAGAVLAAGIFFSTGFNPGALPVLGIGCLSFALTSLLFNFPRWGKIAVFEQIFFALVSFRMLGFSRSSEEVAAESSALTQGILIFTLAAFLLHGMVIYYSLYRSAAGGKRRREFAYFALSAAAAVILLVVILPPDFVKNSIISNLLQDKVDPQPVPIDEDGDGSPDGNLRSKRNLFPPRGSGQGDGPRLEGLPESQWPGQGSGHGEDGLPSPDDGDRQGNGGKGEGDGSGKGSGQSKQYAVMVVAAKPDPVYAAGSYKTELHPLRGFLPAQDEVLNRLPTMRLLETWFDSSYDYEMGRSAEEVFFFSTLPEKYLPYRPLAVEPTVLQRGYGPFRYSHRVRSRVSVTGPRDWTRAREMNPREKEEYARFLDAALAKNDSVIFEAHLRGALEKAAAAENSPGGFFGRILAILKSFETFQYNVGYTDDTSIPALVDFLTYTKEGDCTEFSNTAAVLGRLAGIPSRVVTGFLASGNLQTPAHIRGLTVLRNQIKILQDYPLEELFLVTTAHRHSWVQFWLPEYGWIDFESTTFAIPPVGMGDANNRDVVIPLFEKEQEITPLRSFPWRPVLRGLGILAAGILAAAYVLRYGREVMLRLRGRKCDAKGIRAVYGLLLMRLAAEGRPIKTAAQTPKEYAGLLPDEPVFWPFAALYTELRYRDAGDSSERQKLHAAMRDEYRKILTGMRRPGPRGAARRIFSLRGLAYL
jgi:hypothetical protein